MKIDAPPPFYINDSFYIKDSIVFLLRETAEFGMCV